MIKRVLTEISEKLDATYTIDDFVVEGDIGSRIHIAKHYLKFKHRDILTNVTYDFGNYNICEINSNILIDKNIPDFEITTNTNFSRLISFNNKIFKVDCENTFFKSKINHLLHSYKLVGLAKQHAFEPLISGKNIDKNYNINIKYSLVFIDKEKSFLPLLNFHKGLIDLIFDF